MNERQWWSSHVKPRLHIPERHWVAWKVQDAFNAGLPDADCCFEGVAVKLELKYAKEWPLRGGRLFREQTAKEDRGYSGLTVEQRRMLEQWDQALGWSFVLYGVGKCWYLIWLHDVDRDGYTRAELEAASTSFGDSYDTIKSIGSLFAQVGLRVDATSHPSEWWRNSENTDE